MAEEYQISIFDLFESYEPMNPERKAEPAKGEYVTSHGAIICHIMRPAYIGKKVVYDCSTAGHKWYRVGVLEKYIPHEGRMRSIIDTGERQRILLTHYPGIEIYECFQFDEYPDRVKGWKQRKSL